MKKKESFVLFFLPHQFINRMLWNLTSWKTVVTIKGPLSSHHCVIKTKKKWTSFRVHSRRLTIPWQTRHSIGFPLVSFSSSFNKMIIKEMKSLFFVPAAAVPHSNCNRHGQFKYNGRTAIVSDVGRAWCSTRSWNSFRAVNDWLFFLFIFTSFSNGMKKDSVPFYMLK